MLTTPGRANYMAVFTPSDNVTYREVSIYVNVNVTGTAITSGIADKKLDLSGGTWKNETAYSGQWNGTFYKLNDFIEGVDLSQYTTMNVTTEVYDKNGNILSDTSTGFVGFKLANKNGDKPGRICRYGEIHL